MPVARFMTDPHEMRAMAGRFDVHAQSYQAISAQAAAIQRRLSISCS